MAWKTTNFINRKIVTMMLVALVCAELFGGAGMVSLDTRSGRERSYNSGSFFYDYIEIFLCRDVNETFWGALNGGETQGYLLTRYDLNTGKKLKQIRLPKLDKYMDHGIACFPESGRLVFIRNYYGAGGTPLKDREIIQYDTNSATVKILAERPADYNCDVFRVNPDMLLVTENAPEINGETTMVFRDLNTGAEKRALLPYREICHILAVSPDGKRLLASTFHRLFIYDVELLKVTHILMDEERGGISFEGGFSPDGGRVVFAVVRHEIPELYLWNATTGQPPELLANSKAEFDFFSPVFLNDSTIVYRGDNGGFFPECPISFFDLKRKAVAKTIRVCSVQSPLFVIGSHLVFVK